MKLKKMLIIMMIPFGIVLHPGLSALSAPLSANNRFPAMLMFLTPSPDTPVIPQTGKFNLSVSVDYTSVFVDEETDDWEVLLDFEMTTVALKLEFAPCDGFSITGEMTFADIGSGFLDGFLDEYHSAFDFPDYGRSERPHNVFESYIMASGGRYWFQAENEGFKAVDSVVSLKKSIIQDYSIFGYSTSLAVKYSLKVPIGDYDQGMSSRGYDHGLFLLSRFSKEELTYYLNPGVIFLEQPETKGADVSVSNMATVFAGVSYHMYDQWKIKAQLNCFTSPFDMGIKFFDRPGIELTLGVHYLVNEQLIFEFAFAEDLSGSVPDFTVFSGLIYSF